MRRLILITGDLASSRYSPLMQITPGNVQKRFLRKDFGHMDLQITIDDPKAYSKPWTVSQEVHLLPDTELLEFICNENNRDVSHLPGF